MGIEIENLEIIAHTQPGRGYNDYRLRAHKGNANIDTTSGSLDQTEYEDLKAKSLLTGTDFDTAAASYLGVWYTALGSNFKTAAKEAFSRL